MKKTSYQFTEQIIAKANKARTRRRVVAMLSVVVLLFTMNRTTFLADALVGEPKCGLEEHVHDDFCFDEDGALNCGMDEHVHTDDCYGVEPQEAELMDLDTADEDVWTELVEQPAEEEEFALEDEEELFEEEIDGEDEIEAAIEDEIEEDTEDSIEDETEEAVEDEAEEATEAEAETENEEETEVGEAVENGTDAEEEAETEEEAESEEEAETKEEAETEEESIAEEEAIIAEAPVVEQEIAAEIGGGESELSDEAAVIEAPVEADEEVSEPLPEIIEEPAADIREATVDLSEMAAPFSLRELLDGIELEEVPEAAYEVEIPEAEPADEESIEENIVEEIVDEEADESAAGSDIDAWTLDYDEAMLSVERLEDDYAVAPLESFERAELAVTTPVAEYRLTLVNAAVEQEEEVPEETSPEEAPEEAEGEAAEDDAALTDETEKAAQPALYLGLVVVTSVDETLGFDEAATGEADLLTGDEAEALFEAVESVRAEELPEEIAVERVDPVVEASVRELTVDDAPAFEAEYDAVSSEEAEASEPRITTETRTEYRAFSIRLDNVDASDYEAGFNVAVTLPEALPVADAQLYLVQEGEDGAPDVREIALESDDIEAPNSFSFTAESLDEGETYVLSYTVDFYYGAFEFHLDGEGSMRLSELFSALEIDADAAEAVEVTFSDPALLQVERTEDDWLLTSLAPFQTKELLTVDMADGSRYDITVRDAQNIGHIAKLEVTASDGVKKFDADDTPGNDSGDKNDRVRAYDTVKYLVYTNVEPNIEHQSYSEGRVGYRVAIPNDPELKLDLGAMGWAQNVTETVEGDQRVYTFYNPIPDNEGHAIPGGCTAEVIINVGGKVEGYTFTPQIDVWSEGNEGNKVSANIHPVYVTTKPSYNVVLKGGTMSGLETKTIDEVSYTGFVVPFGVAVELRNTDLDRALRGLELADTSQDITFEIELSTYVTEKGVDRKITDTDFTPRLLEFKPNGQNNDYIPDLPGAGNGIATGNPKQACGKTGDVDVVQEGNKLKVTIKGGTYNCDASEFPEESLSGLSYLSGSKLVEGIFSSYYFTVLMPKEINGKSMTPETQFTLLMDAKVTSMSVTSVTNTTVTEQSCATDDEQRVSRWFTGSGGTHDQEIFYSNKNAWTEPYTPNSKQDGTDYAVVGAQCAYTAGFNEGIESGNFLDHVIAFDQLVKFDDKGISVDPDDVVRDNAGRLDHLETEGNWQCKVLYAYKKNGKGWSSEEELITAKEEDLVYSETYDRDRVCVGKLYQWRGINPAEYSRFSRLSQTYFKIKDDDGVANKTYTVTSTCNGWTAGQFINEIAAYKHISVEEFQNLINTDIGNVQYTHFREYTQKVWNITDGKTPAVNVDRDSENGGYKKAEYDETGYLGHETAGFLCGDTIYVVPYISRINKQVAQMNEDAPKSNYSLDTNQRVADYVLQPSLSFSMTVDLTDSTWHTDVTLTDILPKGLTYVSGSSYLGGTYAEGDSAKEAGTVTDGERIVPEVVRKPDGTTELTWKFNTKVVNGPLPELHYSCVIGDADDPDNDVKHGDTLENVASIITSDDRRNVSVENGNQSVAAIGVSKLEHFSINKKVTDAIEADGTGTFTISVNNTSETDKDDVLGVDVMPRANYNETVLAGSYQLTDMKIDKNKIGSLEDVQIWFTFDNIEKGAATGAMEPALTIKDIRAADSGWQQAMINPDTGVVTGDFVNQWPTAIAYYDAKLEKQKSARISMGFKAQNGRTNDIMYNTFGVGSEKLYMTQTTKVYTRTISGKAWVDMRRDGVFDANSDQPYQFVTAILYDKDGTEKARTTTDAAGNYSFGVIKRDDQDTLILHGDEEYYIVFTQPEGGTYLNVGAVAEAEDEFGNITEANKTLATELGRIDNIRMPSIADMRDHGVVDYRLPDQNVAYYTSYALPSTGGMGTLAYTVGGLLLVLGAAILLLLRGRGDNF